MPLKRSGDRASPPSLASPPSPAPPGPAPRHSRHLLSSFPCPHLIPLPLPPAGAPDATALRAVGLWAARGAVRSTCARGRERGAVRSTCARGGARGGTGGACCDWAGRLMVGAGGLGAGRQRAGWRAQCGRLGLERAERSGGLCATGVAAESRRALSCLFFALPSLPSVTDRLSLSPAVNPLMSVSTKLETELRKPFKGLRRQGLTTGPGG